MSEIDLTPLSNDPIHCRKPLHEEGRGKHCALGEELREARNQLETLVDSMLEGVVVHNHSGKIIRWNGAALQALGLTADQIAGKTPYDPMWRMIREDFSDLPPHQVPSEIALRTGVTQREQILGIHTPNHELRWLAVTAVPAFKDGSEQAYQVLVTFRDITEEKSFVRQLEATRQALEERQRFLDATLSALPCLVSYIGNDLRYRYTNHCYEEWFGSPASSFIGKSMLESLGQAAVDVLQPYIRGALQGEAQYFESQIHYRSGGPRHVQVSYIPDRDSNGGIRGFYAVIHDISEQVRTKELILRKEQEITRILNGLPAMIGYWDAEGRNVHSNKCYTDYFGKTPEEIKGFHISELLGPALYEKNRPFIEGALRGEAQTFEREIPLPSGGYRQTLATYLPDVMDERVRGFFVIVSDISRLKALEKERLAFELKLITASKLSSLGEMAAGIAHEINNPLAIIQGYAAQLRYLTEEGRLERDRAISGLSKIETTVDRIASIVKGLQAFARDAESDPMTLTNLDHIVTETLELCRTKLSKIGVDIRLRIPECVAITCRPPQIAQILMNLISNASDAITELDPSNRWIEISVENAQAQRLRVRVTDSGNGIAPEIAEKMMQPFYTTKEVGKGTGLGLSISKGLAESHHGSLSYDNSYGHTSFVLDLPYQGV